VPKASFFSLFGYRPVTASSAVALVTATGQRRDCAANAIKPTEDAGIFDPFPSYQGLGVANQK
jgi:hypothetical protein